MKPYLLLNAIFYSLYGLFGAFAPHIMAGLMGWTPDVLGLHQIRAISMAMAALGIILWWATQHSSTLKVITLAVVFVTLSFAAGRLLGLILDGSGPRQTYGEIAFELVWASLGFFLYRRSKA